MYIDHICDEKIRTNQDVIKIYTYITTVIFLYHCYILYKSSLYILCLRVKRHINIIRYFYARKAFPLQVNNLSLRNIIVRHVKNVFNMSPILTDIRANYFLFYTKDI